MKNDIINELRAFSKLFKQVKQDEYQLFCPYCGDEVRKPNPRHGHLYVLIDDRLNRFLYHCFRCGKSGLLYYLLLDLGCQNEEILSYLKNRSSINVSKPIKFGQFNLYPCGYHHFIALTQYFYKRTGYFDYWTFGINPVIKDNQLTGISFTNTFGIKSAIKYFDGKFRSFNNTLYFFQDPSDITLFRKIVIVEGPFDAICTKLYLFRDAFVVAALGRARMIHADDIIKQYFYIYVKNSELIYVIDNDINRYLLNILKNKGKVYKPIGNFKDVGEISCVKEVV